MTCKLLLYDVYSFSKNAFYLFERQSYEGEKDGSRKEMREGERMSSPFSDSLPSEATKVSSGQAKVKRQKLHLSLRWLQGSSAAAFPGAVARNWIRGGAAERPHGCCH